MTTFKSKSFEDIPISSPSLDLSCGDGMFMFIHLGGVFSDEFDYFYSTNASNFSHNSFVDIFNFYNENYSPRILTHPTSKINYGTDWKDELLKKSSKLNLYENLLVVDNNNKLQFSDNFFKTIHSNSIYWTKNVEHLLLELYRILQPNGKAILQVATPHHFSTLDKLDLFMPSKAMEILDRKRRETMVGLRTFEEWKKLFVKSGFKIDSIRSVYPNQLVIDIWNIGLRPISHLLIQMNDNLSPENRLRIKNEWVDIFFNLFKPFLNLTSNFSNQNSPYLCFILSK